MLQTFYVIIGIVLFFINFFLNNYFSLKRNAHFSVCIRIQDIILVDVVRINVNDFTVPSAPCSVHVCLLTVVHFFIYRTQQQVHQNGTIARPAVDPNVSKAMCSALYANPSTLLGSTVANNYNTGSGHDQRLNVMNHSRWWVVRVSKVFGYTKAWGF